MTSNAATTSLKNVLITQAIAVAIFVGVPILITLIAPISQLEIRTTDTGIRVTVVRYVLMFIPWKTESVDNVQKIRAEITAEKRYRGTAEERRKGQTGVRLATGQLAIVSERASEHKADDSSHDCIVQADPDLAKSIEKQFDEFVKTRPNDPLAVTVYASWPLSYVLGGVATGFCALYVVCAIIAIVLFPFKLIKKSLDQSANETGSTHRF